MKLFILFIPGIIATSIISSLVSRSRLSNRSYIVSTILLGFTSYLSINLFYNIIEFIKKGIDGFKYIGPSFINNLFNKDFIINGKEILFSSLFAIILGLILSKIINCGIFYTFARKFNISHRTAEEDTWGSLFYNSHKGMKKWVYIIDKELDIVYGGWVSEHSRNHIDNELLLKDVVCYKNSNRKEFLYSFDYLYISKNKNDLIIEMTEEGENNGNKD
jgi:hypothetical protein